MLSVNVAGLDRDISVLLYLGKAKSLEQEAFWHMLKGEEIQLGNRIPKIYS